MKQRIQIYSTNASYVDGTLDKFINELLAIRRKAKKQGFQKINVEFSQEWDYDDCSTSMIVTGIKK